MFFPRHLEQVADSEEEIFIKCLFNIYYFSLYPYVIKTKIINNAHNIDFPIKKKLDSKVRKKIREGNDIRMNLAL